MIYIYLSGSCNRILGLGVLNNDNNKSIQTATNIEETIDNKIDGIKTIYSDILNENILTMDHMSVALSEDTLGPLLSFVELLSRFLIIASCRTLSTGDAFIILNDLFGGEGLTLSSEPIRLDLQGNVVDLTKIVIHPLQLSVECKQFYDLFSTNQISNCKDRKLLRPIISFEVKVISKFCFDDVLNNFLLLSSSKLDGSNDFQNNLFSYLFIIMSSDPGKVCRRSLTIVPTYK
jgi:hypothetical protein